MNSSDKKIESLTESEAKEEVLRRIDEIDDTPFEHLSKFVVEEVEDPNSAEVTPEGGDKGLDIIGHVGNSIYECSFGVEVKHHNSPIGADIVRGVNGALNRNGCGFGSLITSSDFTGPAKDAARESDGPPIRLINGDKLTELMVEYGIGVNTQEDRYEVDKEFWSQFEKFDDELISSAAVPQADRIEVLNHTIRGVSEGHDYAPEVTDNLIEQTGEDWTRRQADYYTLAGAALGFLEEVEGEYEGYTMRRWALTPEGTEYLEYLNKDKEQAREFLQAHIQELDIFEIVINRIKKEKIDHDEVKDEIRRNTEVTGDTIGRRATTVRSWLRDFDEVKMNDEGKTTYDYYKKDLSSSWN